jgi:hypothetical protein
MKPEAEGRREDNLASQGLAVNGCRPVCNRLLRPPVGPDFAPRLATTGDGRGKQECGSAGGESEMAFLTSHAVVAIGPLAREPIGLLIKCGLPRLAGPGDGRPTLHLQMEEGSLVLVSRFLRKGRKAGFGRAF